MIRNAILAMGLFMISLPAFAAKLEDVRILDTSEQKGAVVLKLHASQGPADSYFFVTIAKSDSAAFDKLALILRKQSHPEAVRLNLNIPSFSLLPSGSSYRSESVSFSASDTK